MARCGLRIGQQGLFCYDRAYMNKMVQWLIARPHINTIHTQNTHVVYIVSWYNMGPGNPGARAPHPPEAEPSSAIGHPKVIYIYIWQCAINHGLHRGDVTKISQRTQIIWLASGWAQICHAGLNLEINGPSKARTRILLPPGGCCILR